MDENMLLQMIAQALDIIHREIVMRNAYDVGFLSKDQYREYIKQMLVIPEEEGDKDDCD